jgi:hypothetical protein
MHFRPKTTTCRLRNQTLDKAEHVSFYGLAVLVDLGHLTVEVSRSYSVTPHSVWLLRTSDRLVEETSAWQYTTHRTHIRAPGGILTHSPSKRTAADPCLRPCIACWSLIISSVYITNCYGCEMLRGLTHKYFPVKLSKSMVLNLSRRGDTDSDN